MNPGVLSIQCIAWYDPGQQFQNIFTQMCLFDFNMQGGCCSISLGFPQELLNWTHSVQISKVLVHLCVAENGVTLAHSPQHALEGLHLYPLDQAWHKPTARRDQIRFKANFLMILWLFSGCKWQHTAAHPSLAPSLCIPVHPVTESVSIVGNSSYWGPRASC